MLTTICFLILTPKYRYRGEWALSCSFYDVVSDGKKYVWGAVSRGVPKIDVFDIDTGASVGSFETCGGPRDMDYHPLRDEIWVRCSGTSEDESDDSGTYIDVFAAGSPGVDTSANVMLTDNSTLSAYGQSVVDMSLEDVGYSTVWNQNKLYKVDLSSKKVISQFTVPLAYGMNEVAYSKMNQHIFIRASVCCTCGYAGADNEDCGRYGSDDVTLTTGPFAGQVKQGQCGRCDGAVGVDTLGVYEFDTATEKFVGSHVMPDGTGGDPYSSPDGKWIVLVGYNGGKKLRILKSGSNGVSSVSLFVEIHYKPNLILVLDTHKYYFFSLYYDFSLLHLIWNWDSLPLVLRSPLYSMTLLLFREMDVI